MSPPTAHLICRRLCRAWLPGRALRPALLLVLGLDLTASSCLQVKANACLVSGGDHACDDSQICILPRQETSNFPGDGRGCYTFDEAESRTELKLSDAPEGMVRVPFGLPKRFEASFDGDLDSLEGIVTAAVDERGIDVTGCDLEELRPVWSKLSEVVRERLEQRGRVNTAAIVLHEAHIEWVEKFNEEVDGWLAADCVGTSPDTDTGGTGTDTGDTEPNSGSGTGTEDSTGSQPCTQDSECSKSLPFCDPNTEQCVRCDGLPEPDAACANVDSNVPLCVDGACVACVEGDVAACDAQLLLCDPDAMACVPCGEHTDCPASGACDLLLETPTCFEPENVLDVGAGQPYLDIADALAEVDAMMLDRAVLRLHGAGDGNDFDEPALVDTGAIAFIAAEGDSPLWTRTAGMGSPMLTVSGMDTRVYIAGVSLSESSSAVSPGFTCNRSAVDIRQSRIVKNFSGDIRATNGCELHIQNSFVGGDFNDVEAIAIQDSTLDMLYTTVGAGFGTSAALTCNDGSTVTVRNSIMVSRNNMNEISCPGATMETNATNADTSGTNVAVGDWNASWFVNYGFGDFSLQPGGGNHGELVFAGIANWQSGDPDTDIHGDARPGNAGAPDYPGADVP